MRGEIELKYKAAVVQMAVNSSDKQGNLKNALGFLKQAADEGAKVVAFPDYFLTDTPTTDQTADDIQKLAESIPGQTTKEFSKRARELGVYVVAGSIIEKGEDGKLYSTCAFIGPDGELIGKVRKTHPENAPPKHEIGCGINPGPGDYPIFDTEIGKIGIMIDMDGFAVEVPKILGLKGAEVIFWPVNFSVRFTTDVRLSSLLYSSIAESAYIATAARVGWHRKVPVHGSAYFGEERVDLMYAGGSGIVSDQTYLAAVPDFAEGIAVATIDTELPNNARRDPLKAQNYPYWRRPETYGILTQRQNPF